LLTLRGALRNFYSIERRRGDHDHSMLTGLKGKHGWHVFRATAGRSSPRMTFEGCLSNNRRYALLKRFAAGSMKGLRIGS
jgi:hypothetical protein